MGQEDKTTRKATQRAIMAAERGDAQALYNLGLFYSTGYHVNRDYVEAHKWLNLAAINGVPRAMADRADLAREMSPQEIAHAQRAAREWKARH
ncbi:hypothetical protein [Yunchengibacter salinarum]|uniref:hypothetical protein n=1 Tax=Yunchengibacter salinarum TaxID=3133399 RepID=UPI0035B69C61